MSEQAGSTDKPSKQEDRGGSDGDRFDVKVLLKTARRLVSSEQAAGSAINERFDKFSQRARTVLGLAQEEAQRFNHNYIGTEHLLLALVREGEGVAAKVLTNLGVELTQVRKAVEYLIGRGERPPTGQIGFTPRARKVVELAVDEAKQMSHQFVGTEHLLLGLIREGEGVAAGILRSLRLDLEAVRQETLTVLGGGAREAVLTCRVQARDLAAIDMLVETGLCSTRSEAAAMLIHTGIEARKDLFDRVGATVEQIRQLRLEAQRIAFQTWGASKSAAATEQPPAGGEG